MNNLLKLKTKNIFDSKKLVVFVDFTLDNKTIVLPDDIYSECIKDKDKFLIIKYPLLNSDSIVKLSDLNILSNSDMPIEKGTCLLSFDISKSMQFDLGEDILVIYEDK